MCINDWNLYRYIWWFGEPAKNNGVDLWMFKINKIYKKWFNFKCIKYVKTIKKLYQNYNIFFYVCSLISYNKYAFKFAYKNRHYDI